MEYWRAVSFIWEHPNWLTNLLMVALCNPVAGIIPILPVLVLYGYQCEMLEAMLVRRSNEPYPEFKFDRLMDYLVRGIWPFLVMLLAGICIVPIILLVVIAPVLVMGLVARAVGNGEEAVVAVMLPLIVLLGIAVGVTANIAIVPFVLRSALTQDVAASLDFSFAVDFVRRMWKETLLGGLFLVFVALLAQIVGLLLLCIGIFLTVPVIQFAKVHLGLQLYQLYLARGGRKIPLKGAEVEIV
jgi:hypothetical protein